MVELSEYSIDWKDFYRGQSLKDLAKEPDEKKWREYFRELDLKDWPGIDRKARDLVQKYHEKVSQKAAKTTEDLIKHFEIEEAHGYGFL
ncbi:MAG: hypothetical protein MUP58_03170 [Candidatus Nanohaloarchaeota archaeon QJJ-9]|nr:hypothetical protein [Candidatus Nanohaloarchaeota archaeon QJJ-9]